MGRLEGKRVVITGAASGIGRATARRFASEGARVLAADWNEDGLATTAESSGGRIDTLRIDAGSEPDVTRLIATAEKQFGGLDVVFANAGITGPMTPVWETALEDWNEVQRINLAGPFLALKHAVPALRRAGGGAFIATASVAGLRSGAGPAAYSAAKAGVINLVQVGAYELSGSGIRVNAICPGLIETGMTSPLFEAARQRGSEGKIGQLNPLQRAGAPDEIASTALFLASDDGSYVNGQAIAVCGGLSASHPNVPSNPF
jgi:NAD(P)-dependent dehydrogenase (short-subunit alcohol dehydrogenase family)